MLTVLNAILAMLLTTAPADEPAPTPAYGHTGPCTDLERDSGCRTIYISSPRCHCEEIIIIPGPWTSSTDER